MIKDIPGLDQWLDYCLAEDLGDGDHSSLASIPAGTMGKVKCLYKEDGIVAGVELANT